MKTDSQILGAVRDTLWRTLAQLEEHHDPAKWPDLEAALRLAAREAERCQEGTRHAAIFASTATDAKDNINPPNPIISGPEDRNTDGN